MNSALVTAAYKGAAKMASTSLTSSLSPICSPVMAPTAIARAMSVSTARQVSTVMRMIAPLPKKVGWSSLSSSAVFGEGHRALAAAAAAAPQSARPFTSGAGRHVSAQGSASSAGAADQSGQHQEGGKQLAQQGQGQGQRQRGLARGGRRDRTGGDSLTPFASSFADIWDPFFPNRSLRQMLDTVDRIFEDVVPASFFGSDSSVAAPPVRLPWDVKETSDSFQMRFDMPGLNKEEVSVRVEDGNTLVVKGEHKEEKKEGEEFFQRAHGSYLTRVILPENAKHEHIKAKYDNGVLYLTIPKEEEHEKQAAAKVIDVE
eukprot:jgi/Mesen1/2292/ME000154S01452